MWSMRHQDCLPSPAAAIMNQTCLASHSAPCLICDLFFASNSDQNVLS